MREGSRNLEEDGWMVKMKGILKTKIIVSRSLK